MKKFEFLAGSLIAMAAGGWLSGCATNRPDNAGPGPLFPEGARVLFQGDSITDMARGRTADPNHILGHSYVFLIAAREGAAFPERRVTFINRGISGNTVHDLLLRWMTDTIELKPDFLSILIGVNDLGRRVTAEEYERQYDQLLAETKAALPGVKLVLGEPFGLPVAGKQPVWDKYRADLEARIAIVNKLGAKYHAPVVHYQRMFEEAAKRAPADYWIWDGVHPTYAGHQLMADEWVRAVRKYWPTENNQTTR